MKEELAFSKTEITRAQELFAVQVSGEWSADDIWSVEEAYRYWGQYKMRSFLIDVRSQEEFAAGHIPGAICISGDELNRIPSLLTSENDEVVLYCRTQNRSYRAALALRDLGIKKIKIVYGGFTAWQNHHFEIQKEI
jgi:rhodanese-related sulfurtransferase